MSSQKVTMDGNTAAANIAYALTEVAAIYPITPSSVMADQTDKFSCYNKKNIFGQTVKVVQMQSEAGVAGAIHGASSAGTLTTTFTSSQGLLLMIPNMYKMAGELMPNVIHVASRTIGTHALSIFGDHSDIYACRQTGYAMICSNNPQEVAHMTAISHLSSIKSSIPFLHFFDGFRTSHEIQKIKLPLYSDLEKMVDKNALQNFRKRGLNPNTPIIRGTAQNDDVFFQNREACNLNYENCLTSIIDYMNEFNTKYNTNYKPFEYYGDKNAENIIIAMGSVCETIEETIDYLLKNDKKVGLIKVRVYRPFSAKNFIEVLPKSTKNISVLDRTKEAGSIGEPLYLDILASLKDVKYKNINIYSGRYGLSSKNTNPNHIISVFKNMESKNPKSIFTIGINDDVTNISLDLTTDVDTLTNGTYSCKFWGMGSDGTIGASKNTIKIIGDNTDLNVQGFFSYDSKKSGGITISHLRFGKNPIKSTYYIEKADFISCNNSSYIYKYDILKDLKQNGKFLLNCLWKESELEKMLPKKVKKELALKNIEFYTLDASKISQNAGLGGRINIPLQSAFFKIIDIFNENEFISFIKNSILKTYGEKGKNIVDKNNECVLEGILQLKRINIPEKWKYLKIDNLNENINTENNNLKNFLNKIAVPTNSLNGNNLPVSDFLPYADGSFPLGSSNYEKRMTSNLVPCWNPENCIQCNLCSYVCPHGVIRPFATYDNEISESKIKHKKLNGIPNLNFSIGISVKDCVGCGNCVEVCPGMKGNKALDMKKTETQLKIQNEFDFLEKLPLKSEIFQKFNVSTVKGSQFKKPLLEFSGACAGCGETPYAKLLTQLFGEKMIIANATGCSSIWGASFPSIPYTVSKEKKGPAWHNSLFEDNAEFGYGISIAQRYLRDNLIKKIENISNSTKNDDLKDLCNKYLLTKDDTNKNFIDSESLIKYLEKNIKLIDDIEIEILNELIKNKNNISKKSIWILGGDGWAYDIGYGGLDHILASNENVNILVFDTEVYSNTGGQVSKATPMGVVSQFATLGKNTHKKNLAKIAMSYSHVYVAKVALGANYTHCLKTFLEAEKYNGPSLIIAYSPCINHGIKGGMKNSILASKKAVSSGYWDISNYNPEKEILNESNIDLDKHNEFKDFLLSESRYSILKNISPERFDYFYKKLEEKTFLENNISKDKN